METLNLESLKKHFMKHVKTEQAKAEADFMQRCNKIRKKNGKHSIEQKSGTSTIKQFFGYPVPGPVPFEVIYLPPYADGTDPFRTAAKNLDGSDSTCNSICSRMHLHTGELSLATAQGQLFNTIYSNPDWQKSAPYSNTACGAMGKLITLENGHPGKLKVQMIVEVYLPTDKNLVLTMEPGTLNLDFLAAEGFIMHHAYYRDNAGHLVHATGGNTTHFLQSIKNNGVSELDRYETYLRDELTLTLPPDKREFAFGTMAIVKAMTSRDFSNPGLEQEADYGLTLIDLRSKSDSSSPIAVIPLTEYFKYPPGGIRVFVTIAVTSA